MPSKDEIFVREFILVLGFFGGLLTRLGVDPETEILIGLLVAMETLFPSWGRAIPGLLILFSVILTVASILSIYREAGKLGLAAVTLAWVSGFIIISGNTLTVIGFYLLFGAIALGFVASNSR